MIEAHNQPQLHLDGYMEVFMSIKADFFFYLLIMT